MSRDQIVESLVELAKNFRLHPMKNGDTLKGIKQKSHVISFTLQAKRGSGDLLHFLGTSKKTIAGSQEEVKKVKGNNRGNVDKGV